MAVFMMLIVMQICAVFASIGADPCIYYENATLYLNLTSWIGQTINVSTTNPIYKNQIFYEYSPCNNGVKLENGTMVMARKMNKISDEDLPLTSWSNLTANTPYFDESTFLWQFVYTNGDKCNGCLGNVFFIYWSCAAYFDVSKADEIAPCVFELFIQSELACGGQHTRG